MNRILKINIYYYITFIIISLSRIIKGLSIIDNTLIPLLVLLVSYIIPFIYYKLIKKEGKFNVINTTLPVVNLICYYLTNNITITLILLLILSLLYKLIKINYIAIFYLLYYYICTKLNLDISANYNVIAIIICYVVLMLDDLYKKEIPLFTINSFVLTSLLIYVLNIGNITNLTNTFLESSILYISVFVLSYNEYSPMTFIGKIIYSFIIGISSCIILNFTNMSYLIYIVVIIVNIILVIINKRYYLK